MWFSHGGAVRLGRASFRSRDALLALGPKQACWMITQMKLGARLSAAALLAATIAAGCAESAKPSLTISDARELASLRPVKPGWTWPPDSEKSSDSGASSDDPLLAEFRRETRGLVDLGEAAREWQDDNKLAHVDVGVYKTAADAHKALAPFNALSLGWAKRTGGVLSYHNVDGLGEEAWLLRQAESGEQVTYHWRRANILVEAHMHCFGSCPPGLIAAARAWAERIDAAARRRA